MQQQPLSQTQLQPIQLLRAMYVKQLRHPSISIHVNSFDCKILRRLSFYLRLSYCLSLQKSAGSLLTYQISFHLIVYPFSLLLAVTGISRKEKGQKMLGKMIILLFMYERRLKLCINYVPDLQFETYYDQVFADK